MIYNKLKKLKEKEQLDPRVEICRAQYFLWLDFRHYQFFHSEQVTQLSILFPLALKVFLGHGWNQIWYLKFTSKPWLMRKVYKLALFI